MGFSNALNASTTPATLGSNSINIPGQVTVENNVGALGPTVFLYFDDSGNTPSGATVTGTGKPIAPGASETLFDPTNGIIPGFYWVATTSGTADVRVSE